ncbi:hypothetical protein [Streptomyces sp. NBC_00091]|uniref:hypothetical protein n=1 Tax=Streptomyces sp. NBC_00091 TaxID=2975648 RepID=UPI0022559020|nr:hypothetical protein [Streptomyces sp. NBC_00091]MCX5380709.1 hypothetical protein [Streptomyces sp. NBC_00091]
MSAALRCAVLDDHQGPATTLADRSPVTGRGAEVVTYAGHLGDEGVLAFLDGSPVRVLGRG